MPKQVPAEFEVVIRIDKFNRLIYTIEENIVTVTIISVKGHYGDK